MSDVVPLRYEPTIRRMIGGPAGTCCLLLKGRGGEITLGYDLPLSLADPLSAALNGVLRTIIEAQGMDNLPEDRL